MTRTIIAVIAVLISLTSAFAQSTTVTLESNSKGSQNVAVLHCQNNAFVFVNCCEGGWWQAYVGATYSNTISDVAYQLALGVGAEEFGSRIGGWLWVGQGKVSALHAFEDGGSGPWHRSIAKYQISDRLSLGVTDRAFYGRGIHAEYKLGTSSKVTGEYFEGGKATAALTYSF